MNYLPKANSDPCRPGFMKSSQDVEQTAAAPIPSLTELQKEEEQAWGRGEQLDQEERNCAKACSRLWPE